MASIKCGSCRGTHGSVGEVRACHAPARLPAANGVGSVLVDQGLTSDDLAALRTQFVTYQHSINSRLGYYAVVLPGETALRFFRVNTPTQGRHVGKAFLDEQASDDLYPVRNRARCALVYTAILLSPPRVAQERYGQELQFCGRCNQALTDETSRARGIGPDCWDAMGFPA